jgi:malate synthase
MVEPPKGTRTEAGLRLNIRVAIRYLEAWLNGQGAVPIYNLMEDAATAEISRTQIWQWLHHRATLEDGRTVTGAFVKQAIAEESAGHSPEARALFERVSTSEDLQDFLTLPAYDVLTKTRS